MKWLDRTLIAGPHLALARTEKQFNKLLKYLRVPKKEWPQFHLSGSNSATIHLKDGNGENVCIVTLHCATKDKNRIYSLLVHEAVHVWQYKIEGIGEDRPSDEFEAYSIQAISKSLFDEYKRQVK